jgi:hypothetical protein
VRGAPVLMGGGGARASAHLKPVRLREAAAAASFHLVNSFSWKMLATLALEPARASEELTAREQHGEGPRRTGGRWAPRRASRERTGRGSKK